MHCEQYSPQDSGHTLNLYLRFAIYWNWKIFTKHEHLFFYYNLKHDNLPEYFISFSPVYHFRNSKFLTPSLAHEYIKLTFRYQLPSILNHYIVHGIATTHTTEVRDIGDILTNVQNIPIHVFKSIIKSLLLSEYSYICTLSDYYLYNVNNS